MKEATNGRETVGVSERLARNVVPLHEAFTQTMSGNVCE